jgi:hypothetical protein
VTSAATAGAVLVAGALLAIAGASVPALSRERVWMLPLDDYLRVIADHTRAWRLHAWLFLGGAVLTAIGLFLLAGPGFSAAAAGGRTGATDPAWLLAGAVAYAFAAVAWSASLAFRIGPVVSAALAHRAAGQVPNGYETLSDWSTALYEIYMVVGYLATAGVALGVAVAGLVPAWLGWACVAFGIVGATSFGFSVPRVAGMRSPLELPVLVHVVPLAIGLSLLAGG